MLYTVTIAPCRKNIDVLHSEYGILYSLTTPPNVARPTTVSAMANTIPIDKKNFLLFLLLMSFCRIIRVPFSLTDNRLYM